MSVSLNSATFACMAGGVGIALTKYVPSAIQRWGHDLQVRENRTAKFSDRRFNVVRVMTTRSGVVGAPPFVHSQTLVEGLTKSGAEDYIAKRKSIPRLIAKILGIMAVGAAVGGLIGYSISKIDEAGPLLASLVQRIGQIGS